MKKPLPEKRQFGVLWALLKNWTRATSNPLIAKMVVCNRAFFSCERVRAVVTALLINNGDWPAAKNWLSKSPAHWHTKLFSWADKIQGNLL
jgi:hypothetical protein